MNCSHSTGTHADAPNVDLEGGKTVIRTAATTLTYVLLLSAYPMTEVQPRLQKVLKSRWTSFNSGCRKRGMRTLENEDFHVELNKAIVHYHDWGQGMGKR